MASARLFLGAISLAAALSVIVSAAVREERVRVPGPAGVLAGTLTLPSAGAGPFPAITTLTGSGLHLRDGNRTPTDAYRPFKEIADHLSQCGMAVLRLDDRGAGESAGNGNVANAEDTAADARAAVKYLRGRRDIDVRRIGLMGHSYGGVIAPMVAAADSSIAAVVLMGAPGVNFRDGMRYQLSYRIANDASISAADKERALSDAMRQQELNVKASTEEWRRSIQDRDPLPAARRLRMPVLILQGLTDRAVDPEDARLLERTIRSGGNTRVETKLFPEINHHFNVDPIGATDAYARLPSQAVAPVVLSTMCEWLQKTLK